MKQKTIIIIVLVALLVLSMVVAIIQKDETRGDLDRLTSQVYQGPVPEGYDEQYFRQTGVTIKNEG